MSERNESINTDLEKNAFRAWLCETGKMKSTADAYVTGVNTVSKHYGSNVFGVTDLERLQKLLDDYGTGGIHQDIGNRNSGSVRSGIREWVNFCRTRSGDHRKSISIELTEGAIKNGYITVNGSRDFFPQDFVAGDSGISQRQFTLVWPDGETVQTCVLGKYGRIQARFNSRFRASYQPGTILTITQDTTSDAIYHISVIKSRLKPDTDSSTTMTRESGAVLNQILYGPPGTGKTYHTIDASIEILDPTFFKTHKGSHNQLKRRFDELVRERRVRFVTFHQSFSYEDFVEGLRAYSDDNGQLKYKVEDGVFKQIARDAQHVAVGSASIADIPDDVRIWKISIGGAQRSLVKTYCLQHGEARIGWVGVGDMTKPTEEGRRYLESLGRNDQKSIGYFAKEIAVGDVLVSIDGQDKIGAVGVVTREYAYEDSNSDGVQDYPHTLKVEWLYTDLNIAAKPLNNSVVFAPKTIYPLPHIKWPLLLNAIIESGAQPTSNTYVNDADSKRPYVLVIDEINRGNTSRVFGELITLIEPSKRAGKSDALEVVLPYSKESFCVPDNLYIIGTMNTADRSLSGLDIALRRRFSFVEMKPKPELLDEVDISGVNIGKLLRILNRRIEALLDREHCIGHAYFMPLVDSPDLDHLANIFQRMVLPLLQEYFYEDWKHIQWVLNDHRKSSNEYRFIREVPVDVVELFGEVENLDAQLSRFEINDDAFHRVASYAQTVTSDAVPEVDANDTSVDDNIPYVAVRSNR
ncbi:restriction endonuclease [Burkholderia multivorans]|nr:restriction endonuclease [Burkholderia multivorans]